jgi:predicted NAD/FAD-binding protein
VLGAIAYQGNEVVLHRDESLLPRARAAQASWNYRVPRELGAAALVTYDMNRLQGLEAKPRFLVTLNPGDRVDPERVLGRFHYDHPVFDCEAIRAQAQWPLISGTQRTHFCGAYWGNGFHEDGVRSALAVVESLGRGAI